MSLLPTIQLGDHQVTRLMCGGNPFSGFSHIDASMDWDFITYFTMPNLLATLDECWANGINTFQSRGDRHQMRMYLEHRLNGGQMQWIAQTASEVTNYQANIRQIMQFEPIALYAHGTHADNVWHKGEYDKIADIVKCIKDQGLPAGLGTHMPHAIEYAEEHGWETDFYVTSLYNLAREHKLAVATEENPYRKDVFPDEDPEVMGAVIKNVAKPCFAIKVMAATRNCATPAHTRAAIERAFNCIKPTDGMIVGIFQKYRNQVEENARFAREILAEANQ